MTHQNTLVITLSNSQLTKLISALKNGPGVILNLSSNIIHDSHDEKNFVNKLLLTNTQDSKLHKAFSKGSSTNIKLSKNQLHKIGQSGGFYVGGFYFIILLFEVQKIYRK